jgi:hypothetical protein
MLLALGGGIYLLSDVSGFLLHEMCHINTAVRTVLNQRLHVQLAEIDQISPSQLNHLAELGNALPRFMKQLAGKRVEDEVYASAVGLSHEFCPERTVAGAENPVPWDA